MDIWQNFGFLQKIFWSQKLTSPSKTQDHGMYNAIFSKFIYFISCTECQVWLKHKKTVVNYT